MRGTVRALASYGLYSRGVYNQKRVMMACLWYAKSYRIWPHCGLCTLGPFDLHSPLQTSPGTFLASLRTNTSTLLLLHTSKQTPTVVQKWLNMPKKSYWTTKIFRYWRKILLICCTIIKIRLVRPAWLILLFLLYFPCFYLPLRRFGLPVKKINHVNNICMYWISDTI